MGAGSEPQATRWWATRSPSINGIFKGGGAKGLLYAGAVKAVDEKGEWFRAVAGSSAGAITATLIAAGLRPDELESAAQEGPKLVSMNPFGDLIGRPLARTEKLRTWLEEVLEARTTALGGRQSDEAGPVTFRQLHEASEIELYVVAVDVAERQPIVFSAFTTPELAVSDAVVASSAIPVAFRPGRLEVEVGDSTEVHRMIDGGVWANYPAFVFKDESFREHHGLEPVPADSTTIGFTLEYRVEAPRPVPKRILSGWHNVQGDRGGMLGSWLRLAPIRLYLLTLVPIVIAAQAAWTIDQYGLLFLKDNVRDDPSAWGFLQGPAGFLDGLFTNFWPAYVSVLVVVVLFALLLSVLGATLLDSAIPSIRSLMAVGTNVPYWVGTTKDDHVVRLEVPDFLGTFSFKVSPENVTKAVGDAKDDALAQLTLILPPLEEKT